MNHREDKKMKCDREYVVKMRREIHRHPEIGFELPKTLALVRRELDAMGIPYTEKFGKSSLVATVNPETKGKVIAVRADMDALPIQEETALPFASENPGVMHACGHDCHTSMLLALAKMLTEVKKELRCRVKLIFQAAEEVAPGGAKLMCEDGLCDEVDEFITCHVNPNFPSGAFAINKTYMNASSHGFILRLHGRTSHAARPQMGVDAIAMACQVYQAIMVMRAREINPMKPCLLSAGEIHGVKTNNILCDEVMMHGTIRALDPEIDETIFRRIGEIADAISKEMGGSFTLETTKHYPSLHNDPVIADRLTAAAKKILPPEMILPYPETMGAEDFAFFLQKKPGARFCLGTHKEGAEVHPLHNSRFSPDEGCLTVAPEIFLQYILDNQD